MSVLLLDSFSLLFRAYHALPFMSTTRGEPTQALYGFSALLVKLLREERPNGMALALDRPEPTFRHDAYPAYKGTRESAPSDLSRQLSRLDPLLDAFGFPRYAVRGFEADDVLATLTRELTLGGEHVLVVTGDRDMLQLVSERAEVLFVGQRGKPPTRYDVAAVEKRFGVLPDRLPLYFSMLGDTSDNVPKVKGLGPVAAQRLASSFAELTALCEGAREAVGERLGKIVVEHEAQLRASERLLRLRSDVPLPPGPRHAAWTRTALERTRAQFAELEFQSLIPRLEKTHPVD